MPRTAICSTNSSPRLSNRRRDAYGGELKNRCRLILEVIDAVRAAIPAEVALTMRISATDWIGGNNREARPSWTVSDSIVLASRAHDHGVDMIDVSSGGLVPATIPANAAYQTDIAARIRREAQVPMIGVGRINSAVTAENLVTGEQIDAVMLGRALLRDPSWPNRAAVESGLSPRRLRRYAHCLDKQDAVLGGLAPVRSAG